LLLAEVVVAVCASLADGADLRLDRAFVAALCRRLKFRDLGLETLCRLLGLVGLFEQRGQSAAFLVFGARIEANPGHLRQGMQVVRVALDEFGVKRCAPLRHAAERAKVLANQGHGGLALLYQDVGLDLREGGAAHGA
jgi:hypothetical protein